MLDNKLIQIGLVFLAFYVILQIMNGQVSSEHLDSTIQIEAPPSSVVQVTTPSVSAISTSVPAPSNSLVTPELASTSSTASAVPVVTSAPSAAITASVPHPLSSVEEDIVAAAPKVLPEDLTGKQNANVFAPEPTDLEAMFGRRSYVDPADLIPKVQDAELYGGIAPDPAMAQNFLNNRWSMGIDVSKPKRGFINDLRGVKYPPAMTFPSIWNQATQMPDLYRKSLGDVE